MIQIEWKEDFNTGIPGVDHEHQELIGQINAAFALIDREADKDLVLDLLGDIYGSISAHFALEESLMRQHDYDQYAEHKADHNHLLDVIREFTCEFEESDSMDNAEFKDRLGDWFQDHFKTFDARLHRLTGETHHG